MNTTWKVTSTPMGGSIYDLKIGTATFLMLGTVKRGSPWKLITHGRIEDGYSTKKAAITAFVALYEKAREQWEKDRNAE